MAGATCSAGIVTLNSQRFPAQTTPAGGTAHRLLWTTQEMHRHGVVQMTMLLVFGVSVATFGAGSQQGVQGSAHDFSRAAWNVSHDLCSPCHQGHSPSGAAIQSLWGHAISAANFAAYDSPTFKAGKHAPGGVSLACLSCHDGTVAINQRFGGMEGAQPVYIKPSSQIGPDLHTSHPVSFTYDTALAAADGRLENPISYRIGNAKNHLTIDTPPVPRDWSGTSLMSQTIDQALLFDHKVECSSCHDVHKLQGSAPSSDTLLRVDGLDSAGRGDLLCRTCHIQ